MGGGHLLTKISELLGMRMKYVVQAEHSLSFGSLEFPRHFQRDYWLEFPFDGKLEYCDDHDWLSVRLALLGMLAWGLVQLTVLDWIDHD